MQPETVQISVSYEALATAVSSLSLADKVRLWNLLKDQITPAEDLLPEARTDIQRALDAYAAGDGRTLDEYLTQLS